MAEDSPRPGGPRALEPDEARALLRECAVVVAPGETLVVRISDSWHPGQLNDFMRSFEAQGFPFRVLLVLGEEFAVARAGDPSELTWPEKRGLARQMGQI